MCGIAGIIQRDSQVLDQGTYRPIMEAMLEVMRHRGPDDRGISAHGSTLLGQLRLAILDLSPHGHQPMIGHGGRICITYNGEIYNYAELRQELIQAGYSFSSHTDTEVVLHAYAHWGLACFQHLRGMWGVMIWDNIRHQVVISRDRLGIKPVYWFQGSREFVFSSEIKGIVAFLIRRGYPIEIAADAVNQYLNTGLVDGLEETFIKGIYRFKPAHYMVIKGGDIQSYPCFWNLPEIVRSRRELGSLGDETAQCRVLQEMLKDSVIRHCHGDVPVGVCLSGGMDYSVVAQIASTVIPNVKTFTTWFKEGEDYNELPFAQAIAKAYGLQHFTIETRGEELLEKLGRLLWYLDEPSLAMGIYPQWHVMEAAAKEVTAVLDGQGGDELFAGYSHYIWQALYGFRLQGNEPAYRQTLKGFQDNYGTDFSASLEKKVEQLVVRQFSRQVAPLFPDYFDSFLYQELTSTRLPALLRYEDRLSMAFSIESRVPLLDHPLVEYVFSLPVKKKIAPGWTKYIFRQSMQAVLPAAVTWRKDKKGFPTPFDVWSRGPLKRDIQSLLTHPHSRIQSLLGKGSLSGFLWQLSQGRFDHWVLWRFLSLETWLQTYFAAAYQEVAAAVSPVRPLSIEAEAMKVPENLQGALFFHGQNIYQPLLRGRIKDAVIDKTVILAPVNAVSLDLAAFIQPFARSVALYDRDPQKDAGPYLCYDAAGLACSNADLIIVTSSTFGDQIEAQIKAHAPGIPVIQLKKI